VHAPCCLLTSAAGGDTPGKVRGVCRVVASRPLNNNEETVHCVLPSLGATNAGLLEDAIECTRGEIVARVPRYCNAPGLLGVLELAMTAFGRDEKPAVFFDEPDDISYLHGRAMWASVIILAWVQGGMAGGPVAVQRAARLTAAS